MKSSDKTVLILEDDTRQRDALHVGFSREGFHVVTASNGRDGLEILNGTLPDIILLDLMMPVLDGFAFLDKIKNDDTLKHIPIIVITNLSTQEKLTNRINVQCDYFFTKTNTPLKDIVDKAQEILLNEHC